MANDRRLIASFLAKTFPSLEGATSDEWHFFLDKLTGLSTPLDEPNGVAFDRWRAALKGLGYDIPQHSSARVAAAMIAADKMFADEKERVASEFAGLMSLRKEAPDWPVAEVLASVNGRR